MAAISDPFGEFTVEFSQGSDHVAPGVYDFEVQSYSFDEYPGGAKVSACTRVVLALKVSSDETGESGTIIDRIFLDTDYAWKLTQFFRGIGMIDQSVKAGDNFPMRWDESVGMAGVCEIQDHTFKGKDGEDVTVSQVKKYREPVQVAVDEGDDF